jgi:hypothetical protein
MRAVFFSLFVLLGLGLPGASLAEAFQVVQDRERFMSLVNGRQLTRLGISLNVTGAGQIQGRAFGKPVSGQWRWENGFFCRTLFHGQRDMGPNCQEVRINGNKIRFTSDRGTGQYADLTLR